MVVQVIELFWSSGVSSFPFSLGMNGSTLWYSVPAAAAHSFFNNGTNTLTIDSVVCFLVVLQLLCQVQLMLMVTLRYFQIHSQILK